MSQENTVGKQPQLKRVLGRWDLILLFVVAVFNLNVVPSIAANGGVTLWLWLISFLLFFWPQAIAVIELSTRYPAEGGVYLWAKQVFGGFHGFLSGWCYWTSNMLYIPTVMLYFVGVLAYVLGGGHQLLAESKWFALIVSLALLTVLTLVNLAGLGAGKWINNTGALGTGIAAVVLLGLGIMVSLRFGPHLKAQEFALPANHRSLLNSFGVICFGLVGLELASFMGDEIRNPREDLPGAVAWGGVTAAMLYIATTVTLLVAIGKNETSILQGIVGGVGNMADRLNLAWMIVPFAVLLSASIAGIGSAWIAGCSRIPFVAGLDSYLPTWLGAVHPKYSTPHASLLVQFAISAILVAINFAGGIRVQETFQRLLSLSVVLQLVPYLYMFAAVIKLGWSSGERSRYSRSMLRVAGAAGFFTTLLGAVLVFFPARQISSLFSYEVWMFGGTLCFLIPAVFFFFVYGRRKAHSRISLETTMVSSARTIDRS